MKTLALLILLLFPVDLGDGHIEKRTDFVWPGEIIIYRLLVLK